MTIIKEEIEKNRQILIRLRRFFQTNLNEFQICVSEMKVTLLKFNKNKKNSFSNDFLEKIEEKNLTNNLFNALDKKSNVIIDE